MENKVYLNHNWLRTQTQLIKLGLEFPLDAINGILVTNVDREKSIVKRYKEKVLSFIEEKKKVYLSEISDKFNLDIVETKLILNELEKEGKIKVNNK